MDPGSHVGFQISTKNPNLVEDHLDPGEQLQAPGSLWFVFNATFSNIPAISWRPVLVVEEAGDNH
jgi:hypothetical protein